jgi:hypothetical protein
MRGAVRRGCCDQDCSDLIVRQARTEFGDNAHPIRELMGSRSIIQEGTKDRVAKCALC